MEDLGELSAACGFRLAGTVGEEDVWDFDAELVVAVENLEGAFAFWNEAVAMDEDTVNVEGEGHVFCGGSLDG